MLGFIGTTHFEAVIQVEAQQKTQKCEYICLLLIKTKKKISKTNGQGILEKHDGSKRTHFNPRESLQSLH